MAENSAIEWTTHTFNPWVGCEKVSPACDRCYAESWAKRTGHAELWNGTRRRTTPANWRNPLKWHAAALSSGIRPRVFCASLADVFDNRAEDAWRHDLWDLIEATPGMDWLLLTKRPQLVGRMTPGRDWAGWKSVWLGTTVENQTEADRRISHLHKTYARVKFLSCEPLLEAIQPSLDGINWVICGGESGGGARMMTPVWARSLRDQCAVQGVPFFMKQMTGKAAIPPDLMIREYPSSHVRS